jgi:dTDP-L-rhamnose 4-epimerase
VTAFEEVILRPPKFSRLLDIGSGTPVTVLELARLIADMYGAPAPVVTGAFRDGDVRAAFANIGPAEAELGWRPLQPLTEGLRSLFRYIEETAAS